MITREEAFGLLKKYNSDPFHIQHAVTVEAVMKWFAKELGYGDEAEHWGLVGLLHDVDFELYPDQHCIKAPELLREGGVPEDVIHDGAAGVNSSSGNIVRANGTAQQNAFAWKLDVIEKNLLRGASGLLILIIIYTAFSSLLNNQISKCLPPSRVR